MAQPAGPQAPHATFFGPVARGNPVVDSFEAELRRVLSSLRRLRGAGEAKPPQHDLHRHGANTLFNICIKYKPRLPEWYYNERLVKVGDTLAQIKEYKLALQQCYEIYLQQFVSVNLDDVMDDVQRFKSAFFPNGVRDKNAALMFHVLQARNVCIYHVVCSRDRNLQHGESLQTCLNALTSLRLTMQVALPQEDLCWLIYNGTIHIYTICRHLMVMGHSAKVLEYLLWASICMESSIPLLSVHYLTWRATLYTAVSQCYFDCQAGIHGEIFARRGLIKIDELKQLEDISSSLEHTEREKIFKEATLKMSVMIFKRAVYESRKKSNSFRRESKVNPRKAVNVSWPRTTTERLLVAMFDGVAAQFLAILEALPDHSRNLLPPHPPVPDEAQIPEVTSELFSAGLEILSGGASSGPSHFGIINPSSSLLQLMLAGEEGVSGDAAVKFVKLAFSYEEWNVFYSAFEFVENFLQAQDDPTWKKAELELKLLTLMQPIVLPGRFERSFSISEGGKSKGSSTRRGSEKTKTIRKESLKPGDPFHDLMVLATTTFSYVSTYEQNVHPGKEILVDVVMCLWQKCKTELQQIQKSGSHCLEYMHKHQAYQWVHVLWTMNEIIEKSNIADTNVMFAEITLCLAAILENVADSTSESKDKEGGSTSLSQDETCDMPEILMKTPTEQLQIAYEVLEKAINDMNTSRLMTILPDGKSVFDSCCTKVDSNDQNLNSVLGCGDDKTGTDNGFVADLHLELIQAQHRVAVKLLKITQGAQVVHRSPKSSKSQKSIEDFQYLSEELIMKKIKRNKLSRAIFLMQKAAQKFPEDLTTTSQRQLLEEALTLIEQVEAEQSALYRSLKEAMSSRKKSRTPPPPLLLSRSHCSMTFKPAPFHSDIQVSWYCILGCVAGGSNTKVRLNSNKLQNSGEQILADGKILLEVQGLDANEKYIFAVAAYSSDGKLIGDAIGQMTKPILAYPPLSATTVRAYLTQVAYQMGNFRLARAAFSPTWDYFVSDSSPQPPNAAVISASSNFTISGKRLHFEAVSQTSPIALHLFLRNIFAVSDINVMEGALFCDSICSNEIFYKEQVARLAECERMSVAIELSNWLNDPSYALQSVVQCYGLLAPLIYHKIFPVPVVQILIKCLAVLQEIPSSTLQRRQEECYESILHMIACASYHTAKVLHSWKEYELSAIIINYGKKLLISPGVSPGQSGDVKTEETRTGKAVKRRSSRASHLAAMAKAAENLNSLESSLLKLTEPGPGAQLTGKESLLLLYPVISCWPSDRAYREVLKFKANTRFLEFFVQLLHKVMNEEKFQSVLEWAESVESNLKRRNESFLGTDGISAQARSLTLGESTSAAEVQKGKNTSPSGKAKASPSKKPTKQAVPQKGPLREYLMKNPDTMKSSEAQNKAMDKLKKLAHETLVMLLTKYVIRSHFCQMCLEEMPWKSQMNIYLALAHYHLFKKNLEMQYNMGISGSQHLDSYSILDPEIFSLNNSGTVLAREAADDNTGKPTPSLPEKSEETETQTSKGKSPKTTNKQSQTPRSRTKTNKQDQVPSNALLLKHFTSIFLHLKRAVVLAHRGGHWTLLQNACRDLWSYTQEFQVIASQSHSHMGAFSITWDLLCNTIWLPFYFASDMIIDMIIDLQASSSLKIVDPEGEFCIPSCLGGIADENGGAALHPQPPMDDVNVVDLRWICNLVLKTIELLYHMKKWEALVHIAVRFNIFTHERFTEQVSPLLVYAQRQLLERIQQFSGSDSHESHFTKYLSDDAQKMRCRNYIGYKLQLPVARSASEGVFPGRFFNPPTNKDSTALDHNQAKALVSVPLDVNDTLKCFKETLEKSKYQSRALRHSRKLLSLFLAHTQENTGRAISSHISSSRKLKFSVVDEVIFLPTPCDLSQEKYNFSSMVEGRPIPKSHLSVITSSYEHTIGILEMSSQRDLKVQALHELGNLHFYAGNKRAAFKYWCQSLDEALNIADALNTWQELYFPKDATDCFAVGRSTDMSEKFLSQAGAWGCLHAAVLVAKIAQYITTSKIRLRTKYCYFSAILFKTLFRASLPHPTSDCDFAQYETNILIPGIDLFSDRYRAEISTVVASLNFIMLELHSVKQNLIILPLFTLYQYIVSEICKDPAKCIEGRILKIKVLTDIGFFTGAFHELSLLISGERIPWKIPAGYRCTEQVQASQKFDTSKSLMTDTNLQVLEDTFNWSLSLTVAPLCNPQMMNKLTLAKMHLIICLSATINNIPEKVEKDLYFVDDNLPEPSKTTASNVKVDADQDSRQQEQRDRMVRLVGCKDKLNMAMLKGILLTEAEETLGCLVQDIQEKYDGDISRYSVEDLEALIEAKLELASISHQRHQAPLSVALAFSAIRFFQDAKVFCMDVAHFQEEKDEREHLDSTTEGVSLPPRVTAQGHVNVHLWLRCRAMLVTALMAQIHGIGEKKGNEVAERRSVIKEAILEAEAFGDIETQAEVMVQAAILDLQEKRPVAGIKLLLQNIIGLLQEDTCISLPASLTFVKSMLLLADILPLQVVEDSEHCSSAVEPFSLLVLAHKLTIKAIFDCGELIERQGEDSTLTCLVLPLKNIYLPHINLLALVKMKIGHTLAEKVASTAARLPLQWLHALRHLESALNLCRAAAAKKTDLEVELLFQMGKVKRQTRETGSKLTQAVETLFEAIKLSQQHDQKYELVRRAYLEIALSYFRFAETNEDESDTDDSVFSKYSTYSEDRASEDAMKSEAYKAQAWIAIRAASQVSEAMLASQLLIGMKSVKDENMKDEVQQKIPEFAFMDLFSSYRDFISDGYNVVSETPEVSSAENKEITEDCQSESEGTESLVTKASQKKDTITWILMIRYHNHLKRMYNINLSGTGSLSGRDGHLGLISDTGIVLRIAKMHSFLEKHLLEYSVCCPENFPAELHDVEIPLSDTSDSSEMSIDISETISLVSQARAASTAVSVVAEYEKTESRATVAPDKEINIQWYIPPMAKESNDRETKVLLLYAYNISPIRISDISSASMFSGHFWIPLARIISLREKLSDLKEQIELSMQAAKSFPTSGRSSLPEQNETLKIIPPFKPKRSDAKVHLDGKIEEVAKMCLSEVKALLSVDPALSPPLTEIPFDVTLQSITSLKDMFDLANGCIISDGSLFNWMISLLR